MREIRFYRAQSGRSPVEEFLDSLSGKQAQKVVWVLRLVEEMERVPVQYLKKPTGTKICGRCVHSMGATPSGCSASSMVRTWWCS